MVTSWCKIAVMRHETVLHDALIFYRLISWLSWHDVSCLQRPTVLLYNYFSENLRVFASLFLPGDRRFSRVRFTRGICLNLNFYQFCNFLLLTRNWPVLTTFKWYSKSYILYVFYTKIYSNNKKESFLQKLIWPFQSSMLGITEFSVIQWLRWDSIIERRIDFLVVILLKNEAN